MKQNEDRPRLARPIAETEVVHLETIHRRETRSVRRRPSGGGGGRGGGGGGVAARIGSSGLGGSRSELTVCRHVPAGLDLGTAGREEKKEDDRARAHVPHPRSLTRLAWATALQVGERRTSSCYFVLSLDCARSMLSKSARKFP